MRRSIILAALVILAVTLGAAGGAMAANPLLITNAGQGAESAMVNTLCKVAKMPAVLNDTIKAEALAGSDGKPLFSHLAIVVGYSGKGMGAAGIDLADEIARTAALLKKAQALKIPIIIVHIGGYERRGENSDKLIREVFKYGESAIFLNTGNYPDSVAFNNKKPDNLLNNSLPKGVTPKIVEKMNNIIAPLKEIMGL